MRVVFPFLQRDHMLNAKTVTIIHGYKNPKDPSIQMEIYNTHERLQSLVNFFWIIKFLAEIISTIYSFNDSDNIENARVFLFCRKTTCVMQKL